MTSKKIIVLCRPDESRNIGSVCRAMMNMDLDELRIVGKKEDYDDEKVRRLAVHAGEIWEKAVFFDTLKEAIEDCFIAAGTTRRKGKKRKNYSMTPEEFCDFANKTAKGKVAIVFGNERTGLTDEELEECNCAVNIPSSDKFPSLNLSHAVQIMAYTIYRASSERNFGYEPISLQENQETVKKIITSLKKIGFFTLGDEKEMKNFFTNMISRAVLSKSEVRYLEQIFSKSAGLINKKT